MTTIANDDGADDAGRGATAGGVSSLFFAKRKSEWIGEARGEGKGGTNDSYVPKGM
jgi:hypothetical protein